VLAGGTCVNTGVVGYVPQVESPSRRPDERKPRSLEKVPPGTESLRHTAVELAERIEELLDAAERSAEEIEQEARRSAERYLAQRRGEADDEVSRRLQEARRDLEGPALALGEVSATLRGELERALADVSSAERTVAQALERLREAVPAATPQPQADGPGGPSGPEEAVLRAAQLAVTGVSREEIASTLVTEYGNDDVEAIVDEILGR
jgi:hypothetical protein